MHSKVTTTLKLQGARYVKCGLLGGAKIACSSYFENYKCRYKCRL